MRLPIVRANPPRFLFLQTNQRCNLRCTHCAYWLNSDDERDRYLSMSRRIELLEEFKELGGEALVTCGGEPMLDIEEYFALTKAAAALGLRCLSVTNGTRVSSAEIAERMILEGPSEITVSVDHDEPAENDRLRGVPGAHRAATRALELLLWKRSELKSKKPIYVMTILSEDSWRTLPRFYHWALWTVGVDKLKLNIVQPSFQGRGPDRYFESARVRDVDACMKMIRECDLGFYIRRNPEWYDDVEMYLRSIRDPLLGWDSSRETERAICNSYDRNIMLDLFGNARLCFNTLYPSFKLEQRGDLASYWNVHSLHTREKMIGCKQYCGISHSVRKSESTLK